MLRNLLPSVRRLSSLAPPQATLAPRGMAFSAGSAEAGSDVALVDSAVHGDFRKARGTGGRKAAAAQVWLRPGEGEIVINEQHPVSYFDRPVHRQKLLEPFIATDTVGRWDVRAVVKGGGLTGQAEADSARLAAGQPLGPAPQLASSFVGD